MFDKFMHIVNRLSSIEFMNSIKKGLTASYVNDTSFQYLA